MRTREAYRGALKGAFKDAQGVWRWPDNLSPLHPILFSGCGRRVPPRQMDAWHSYRQALDSGRATFTIPADSGWH